MKKIYFKYVIGILFLSLLTASCSNMDELNTDDNKTTKVNAEMLCSSLLLKLAKPGGDAKSFIASNALPKYVAYATEGAMAEQYNKLGASDFGTYSWMPNLDDMIGYAKGTELEDAYMGVYHFARAYMLYGLTMKMGDVPFSQANQASIGNITPIYDSQEQNFIDILNELESAYAFFTKASGTTFRGDIIYSGNVDKWAKATNSFALKVLITLSQKTSVASIDVKGRFQKVLDSNVLLSSNSDNFQLVFANESNRFHPLYKQEKFTIITLLSSLMIDNLKDLNDYRIFYFAEPTLKSVKMGMLGNDMDSYAGVDVSSSVQNIDAIYNDSIASALNKRYSALHAAEPYNLISYAEQNLIVAEAIELGWTSGSAQGYYEEGVKSALRQVASTDAKYAHGSAIDETYIQNYFVGNAVYKSNKQDRLEQIWMQKYILHFMQDPITSFFEYRRVGYPNFPINPSTSLNDYAPNKIPVKWLYPTVESNRNAKKLNDALVRQFGEPNDNINNVMWLLNN